MLQSEFITHYADFFMKILHTSDWHIGATLHRHDRSVDHDHIFGQIARIAAGHDVDAIVVSGDIYHWPAPTAAAMQTFDCAIEMILTTVPHVQIIITAGNHDSASRLESPRRIFRRAGVVVTGTITDHDSDDDLRRKLLVPVGRDGQIRGYILALPYLQRLHYTPDFTGRLQNICASRPHPELPLVMTAHTTVSGADYRGHSDGSELMVGGIDSIPLSALGNCADYIALGHIHHAQNIRGSHGRARYSGSPLAVSFDEDYEHSVSIITVDKAGGDISVDVVPLEQKRPLVTVGGAEGLPWKEALKHLKRVLKNGEILPESFIRLNVRTGREYDEVPADCNDQARTVAEAYGCLFCTVNAIYDSSGHTSDVHSFSTAEFRSLPPLQVACMYADRAEKPLDDELMQLLDTAIIQAGKETGETDDNTILP